jgi:bacteriocin-like protein
VLGWRDGELDRSTTPEHSGIESSTGVQTMSERNPEEKASEIVSPAGKITVDKGELSEEDLKQVSGGGSALPHFAIKDVLIYKEMDFRTEKLK